MTLCLSRRAPMGASTRDRGEPPPPPRRLRFPFIHDMATPPCAERQQNGDLNNTVLSAAEDALVRTARHGLPERWMEILH